MAGTRAIIEGFEPDRLLDTIREVAARELRVRAEVLTRVFAGFGAE